MGSITSLFKSQDYKDFLTTEMIILNKPLHMQYACELCLSTVSRCWEAPSSRHIEVNSPGTEPDSQMRSLLYIDGDSVIKFVLTPELQSGSRDGTPTTETRHTVNTANPAPPSLSLRRFDIHFH